MADDPGHLHIEKLRPLRDKLDTPVSSAFRECESIDLQWGADWLANMAATALDEGEEAVVYIARRSAVDFVACPMKVNARRGQADSLSTFYTSSYSPIVASADPESLFLALFRYLRHVEGIAIVSFAPMAVESNVFSLMRRAMSQAGWSGVHSFFCFGNWIHDLEGMDYKTYMKARPSRLRNTIARRTRQFLAEKHGKLELITGGDDLENAIERFNEVYNASWKRREPYPNFIPQLLRMSALRGWLRLGIASYDGRPVASQIWLICAGTAYIFKLAYHEDYGRLSPGTVLTAYMMEHVIDSESVSRIDYLSGDDDYKRDWMSVRRERHGIAAYNLRTVRGGIMHCGRQVKTILGMLRGK